MNLNDFFTHKVCINLDKRSDRWGRMLERFALHDIGPVARFPAFDGGSLPIPSHWHDFPGAYGCLRSHLAVVEQARAEGRPSVLIFEDDAVLDPQLGARFDEYVRQLPDDWDMIYFGGIHGVPPGGEPPPTRVAENVMRVTHSLSTYAYALRHTVYDAFIELNRRAPALLDENTRELQKHFNCYCFMPHLAWVEEDFSDVRGEQIINLWWLKESLVLWGAEMDEVLSNTAVVIFHRDEGRHAARNLSFITDYYRRKLPGVSLLVVERGGVRTVAPELLPPGCGYELLGDAEPNGRGRAFNLGLETFEGRKDFFVFLDSDTFLPRDDIKANLLKCREYDFAAAFRELYDLDDDDTQKILDDDVRWDGGGNYRLRPRPDLCDSCCVFTARGLRAVGGWDETDVRPSCRTSQEVRRLLRVYQSPNPARRLSRGEAVNKTCAS